ncbi:MAG: hypothetical protein AAAFM81_12590, partial [Pseudomonadota bacterium]
MPSEDPSLRVVVQIHDVELIVRSGGQQVAAEPGYARYQGRQIIAVGGDAFKDARRHPRQSCNDYWYRLSTEPLPNSALTRADLVSAQLDALVPKNATEVVLVVPGYLESGALSLLLGILKANNVVVAGIVDAAVAATKDRYEDQTLLH